MNKEVFSYYAPGERPSTQLYLDVNREIGIDVAEILNAKFCGEFLDINPHENVYLIPSKTIKDPSLGRKIGIYSETDFLGGVVMYEYLRTKTISHGLVSSFASHPDGWSSLFPKMTEDCVLPGYSTFSKNDARTAYNILTKQGHRVRSKKASSHSGKWQTVVENSEQLEDILSKISDKEMSESGYVFELNLEELTTLSVGQVQIGDKLLSYYGTQIFDNRKDNFSPYIGSRLHIIRGGFSDLLALDLPPNILLAVTQAIKFDSASSNLEVMASRRNYDVAQGYDKKGNLYSGVLEQSWRIGGATGAELVACKYFLNHPDEDIVVASSYVKSDENIPENARIYGKQSLKEKELIVYATIDQSIKQT